MLLSCNWKGNWDIWFLLVLLVGISFLLEFDFGFDLGRIGRGFGFQSLVFLLLLFVFPVLELTVIIEKISYFLRFFGLFCCLGFTQKKKRNSLDCWKGN